MIEVNLSTLDYIRQHADEDVRQLALRGHKCLDVDLQYALEQIAGRQKARTKLPSWAAIDGIVYPPHLSMEQCSSEATARYKASIAGKGALFVDLTAGFGVDMALISQGFQKAVHVEQQPQLCAISSENFRLLGLNHIEVVCGDGVAYLHTMRHADLLFIDPARRDVHGKADRVMIKLSPMLDWRKAVADLGKVNEVHIISVDNECKELLLILSKTMKPLRVFCVNNDECFEAVEDLLPQPRPLPQDMRYLYEPNASVMKAGCFDLIEQRFGVVQLERNSHLFVSDKEILGFPGRQFLIEKRTSMNKRELKATLADVDQANITVRNFPMSVAELRKRLKLKEGGDVYIFATTISDEGHQLLVCRKKT